MAHSGAVAAPAQAARVFITATARRTTRAVPAAQRQTPAGLAPAPAPRRRAAASSRSAGAARRAVVMRAAGPPKPAETLRLNLPSDDVREAIELVALPQGKGKAIVVAMVDPGSAAAAAGVRPGQQLLAVSDPVRFGDVWELDGRSSLRYVKDALRMRRAETLQMRLTIEPINEWEKVMDQLGAAAEAAAEAAAAGGGEQPAAAGGAAEKLDRKEQMQQLQGVVKQQEMAYKEERQRKIEGYMEKQGQPQESSTRKPFFAVAIAVFLLLPGSILFAAWSSGYLTQLSGGR